MSPEIGHRKDIDGLRAIAVVAVVLFHLNANWLPGGFTGVDIFFVISGYVVTLSLLRRHHSSVASAILGFYARRLARILPNLLLMLLVTAMMTTWFVPTAWLSNFNEVTARYAFFGLSNIALQRNSDDYFSPITEYNPFTHTWSLGVEEQFYLVVPLLLLLWIVENRKGGHRNWGTVLLVAGCTMSLVLAAYFTQHSPRVAFYFIGTRFWELGTGVLLALHTWHYASLTITLDDEPKPKVDVRRRAVIETWTGLALLLAGLTLSDEGQFPLPWALLPVIGSALLILGCARDQGAFAPRILSMGPMNWIGLRSYALYLWHWPVIVLLRWTYGIEDTLMFAIAIAIMLLLASLTYRFVEKPAINLARWQSNRVTMTIHVTLLAGSFLAAISVFGHSHGLSLSTVTRHKDEWYAEYRSPQSTRADWRCRVKVEHAPMHGGVLSRVVPYKCSVPPSGKALFALGDSHTNHYAPLFWRLAASEGMEITVYTGCSYLNLRSSLASSQDKACNQFIKYATSSILASARPNDIFMPSSLRIHRYADQWGRPTSDMDLRPIVSGVQAAEYVKEAVEQLKAFAEHGMHVLIPAPTPVFTSPAFRCSDWFNRWNPVCHQPIRLDSYAFTQQRAVALRMINEIRSQVPNLVVWDPAEVLCSASGCDAMSGEQPMFFDGDHLSAFGNHVLYPSFSGILKGIP